MELDQFFNLSSTEQTIFLIAVTALAMAVLAIFSGVATRRKMAEQNYGVKQRVDVLWTDMNELRIPEVNDPFTTPESSSGNSSGNGYSAESGGSNRETSVERFSTEKAAYESIWPMVWALHDKLGMFLRAVEADEQPGDLRIEARNAALDARKTLSRVRPFCRADIDELITQVIDNHIKAHLAACHLLDLRKDSLSTSSEHEQAVQKEEFRILYDGQAREMLDRLVGLIRQRILG